MGIRGAITTTGPHVYDDYCGDKGANKGGEDFLLDPVATPRRGYKPRSAHSGLCLGFLNDTTEVLAPLFQLPCDPGSAGQVFLLDPR